MERRNVRCPMIKCRLPNHTPKFTCWNYILFLLNSFLPAALGLAWHHSPLDLLFGYKTTIGGKNGLPALPAQEKLQFIGIAVLLSHSIWPPASRCRAV